MDTNNLTKSALATIDIELAAIQALPGRIDAQFLNACALLLNCKGRAVVTGMGKSGHIGSKLAATLASTGTPAFFVHPGEASHGDMGMITSQDVVIGISHSGNTHELNAILPLIKRMNAPLIAMTGGLDSPLAKAADAVLNCGVDKEACPHNLAPTASTTATLVMGDALAIALLEARGFTAEDFAFSHPGGSLGRKLLLKVGDIMHSGDAMPRVRPEASFSEALVEMSGKQLGMTAITDAANKVVGIFTDGDLRRALNRNEDVRQMQIGELIGAGCKTIRPDSLAAEAVHLMQSNAINALLVTDTSDQLVGALNMHDLLRAGVV